VTYAHEISAYIDAAKKKAGEDKVSLDFSAAELAVARFADAAKKAMAVQSTPPADTAALNRELRAAEAALVAPAGLPNRPWYKHTIYAPGEYTGYAAVVIPGVNEAIDAKDQTRAEQQIGVLAQALDRAAQTLESAH
jgi:N-acetylated-alpha-linked acidic dipeptidase